MSLHAEPLTDANLDEVISFIRASNPFSQHTWGWDTGRFMDWRWGHNTDDEAKQPGWFSQHCQIFRSGDAMRALSVAEYGREAECIITPGEDGPAVRHVLDHLAASHAASDRDLVLEANGAADWLSEILREAGFTEEPVTGHEWEFRLAEQTAAPEIADGFSIESLVDDPDGAYDGINECTRQAFGSTYDFRPGLRSIEGNPFFHPELSVFARSPDGRIAAYCRGTVDPDNGVCGIDPICTHPEFHRLGLGKAVVLTCFQRQRDLGGQFSYVGSGPEPAPGTYLYRSLGPSGRADTSTWRAS